MQVNLFVTLAVHSAVNPNTMYSFWIWTQIQVLKFVTNWTRIRVFLHAVQYSYIIDFEKI